MPGWTNRLLYWACIAAAAGLASFPGVAEELPRSAAADSEAPRPGAAPLEAISERAPAEPPPSAISGNLAAVNIVTGSGLLGRALGFDPDSGIRIGGVWVGNENFLLADGEKPRRASFNSLLVGDLNLDFAKLAVNSGHSFCSSTVSRPTSKLAW
jgi:porin